MPLRRADATLILGAYHQLGRPSAVQLLQTSICGEAADVSPDSDPVRGKSSSSRAQGSGLRAQGSGLRESDQHLCLRQRNPSGRFQDQERPGRLTARPGWGLPLTRTFRISRTHMADLLLDCADLRATGKREREREREREGAPTRPSPRGRSRRAAAANRSPAGRTADRRRRALATTTGSPRHSPPRHQARCPTPPQTARAPPA